MRQVVFGGLSATIEHIRANMLRPLAVTRLADSWVGKLPDPTPSQSQVTVDIFGT